MNPTPEPDPATASDPVTEPLPVDHPAAAGARAPGPPLPEPLGTTPIYNELHAAFHARAGLATDPQRTDHEPADHEPTDSEPAAPVSAATGDDDQRAADDRR